MCYPMYSIFDFEYGKCYGLPEWEGTGMCLTLGNDFTYEFGVCTDGIFHRLQKNYLPDITKLYNIVN